MTNELEASIKSSFGIINVDQLKTICSFFKLKTYKKGEFLLKTKQQSNALSFIQDGLMRIYVTTEDKEITQWISTKGNFTTDLSSFIFGTPSRWNIQALVDSQVYTIHKNDYDKLNELIPEWNQLEKLFIAKCFTFLEDRIFSHLSMTAEERYNFFFEHNRQLFNQVPLQYIASLLGMTPETFSRIRKKQLS